MKKFINKVFVEGYVFSHNIKEKVAGENAKNPGTEFIQGSINIAVDEDGLNVIPVNYSYVTKTYKNGKQNETYTILKNIIDNDSTWESKGKEGAAKVRVQGDVEVNDYLGRNGEMVEQHRVRGGFTHWANDGFRDKRNYFETDILIAASMPVEQEDGDDYLNLRGYVFNWSGALVPVIYSIHNKDGIRYFENQNISNANPLLTKVWGKIYCTTVKTESAVESAFGAPQVNVTTRTLRAWEVEGSMPEPYEWDSEATITIAEFKEKLAERQETIAEAKAYGESRNANNEVKDSAFGSVVGSTTASKSPTSSQDFKF